MIAGHSVRQNIREVNYIYFAGRLRKFLRTLPDGLSGKIYMLWNKLPCFLRCSKK